MKGVERQGLAALYSAGGRLDGCTLSGIGSSNGVSASVCPDPGLSFTTSPRDSIMFMALGHHPGGTRFFRRNGTFCRALDMPSHICAKFTARLYANQPSPVRKDRGFAV